MDIPPPSALLLVSFIAVVGLGGVLAVSLAGAAARREGLAAGPRVIRVAIGVAVWMALTGGLAASGALLDFSLPPRVMLLFVASGAVTVGLATSAFGRQIALHAPIGMLIGLNAFRVPLELTMHRAAAEGIMPPQMSFSGHNFDIVTGLLAFGIGVYSLRAEPPRWLVVTFNVVGSTLLLVVLGIAITSMPTPFRVYSGAPPNVWVAHFPFVWLPTVLVQLALFCHVLIARRLMAHAPQSATRSLPPNGRAQRA